MKKVTKRFHNRQHVTRECGGIGETQNHAYIYAIMHLKMRNNRAPRLDAIAIFAILTPPTREAEGCTEQARIGSLLLKYISRIDG